MAIDYLVKNISGSPLTTGAKATLLDDQGNSYRQDKSIEPPSGGTDGMELGTAQINASTMFFEVPNGIIPATLEIEASGRQARINLLERDMENVPPDDYLRVPPLFQRTGLRGGLRDVRSGLRPEHHTRRVAVILRASMGQKVREPRQPHATFGGSGRAVFQMTRTFYDADGDIVADPEINPSVTQEMVEVDGEWKLVMRDDLVSDIIAVIGPDESPEPKAPEPEKKAPNAPSHLRLSPRPRIRPRPPHPRHVTTTAMISRPEEALPRAGRLRTR